ncbi:hypothetical protein TSUD_413750 [Trifolium subterraneum]|uniref:Uncharacterized protein n=1 Tax=Trifolium subterraneum TaxID=3900 RepID=A0A2Z6P4Y8_TRISU|nr:hypothetical protein TSUD_413750 [Trifolium subterraneum]
MMRGIHFMYLHVGSLKELGDTEDEMVVVREGEMRTIVIAIVIVLTKLNLVFVGGSGFARNITYEDIILVGVKHPVIIDQFYDPKYIDNVGQAVEVSDVTYLNIRGTSLDKIAIELNCDTIVGCTNIVLDNVNITRVDGGEAQTNALKQMESVLHVIQMYLVFLKTAVLYVTRLKREKATNQISSTIFTMYYITIRFLLCCSSLQSALEFSFLH